MSGEWWRWLEEDREGCEQRRPRPIRREMFRGDSLQFRCTLYQDTLTGTFFTVPVTSPLSRVPERALPVDLSGVARMWVTVKRYVQDPDNQAVLELDNLALGGVSFLAPTTAGVFSVLGPALAFRGMADGDVPLRYDTQIQLAAGALIFTPEFGVLVVRPDVTRAIS